MAEEIIKVIRIEGDQAVQSLDNIKESTEDVGKSFSSLGEYKKYIDSLKASLLTLDETSEEYGATVLKIQSAQDKLNQVMSDCKKTTDAASGSYNALTQQMAELKKQWKATADEAERDRLGQQILDINNQLKELDASTGNFQRNVGNYQAAFTEALDKVSDGFDTIIPGTKQVTDGFKKIGAAMKALIANPIGAVVTALVAAFTLLKKAFEQNEEATTRVKEAWQKLSVVFEPLKQALIWLSDKVADLVTYTTNSLPKVLNVVENLVNGTIKGINYIKKPFQALISLMLNGLEGVIKVIDKIPGVTLTNAISAIDKAKNAVKDFEVGSISLAQAQKKLQERMDSVSSSASNVTDTVQDATTAVKDLKNQSEETEEALKELGSRARDVWGLLDTLNVYAVEKNLEDIKTGIKELVEGDYISSEDLIAKLQEYVNAIDDPNLKKVFEENLAGYWKGTLEGDLKYYVPNKLKEIAADPEAADSAAEAFITEWLKKAIEVADSQGLGSQFTASLVESAGKLTTSPSTSTGGDIESKLADLDAEEAHQLAINELVLQSEADRNNAKIQLHQEYLNKKRDLLAEELTLMKANGLEQSTAYQELSAELQKITDSIISTQLNSFQELQKNVGNVVSTYGSVAQGVTNLLSAVTSGMQQKIDALKNGNAQEQALAKEEFERLKRVQIASAIITGLQGAATAFATAMQLGPIAGPIVGAINAALVGTTTAIQVAQIKKQTLDGGGSTSTSPGTVAASSSPTYSANDLISYSQATTSGVNESELTTKVGDQKVYILESDLKESDRRVQIREENTTF